MIFLWRRWENYVCWYQFRYLIDGNGYFNNGFIASKLTYQCFFRSRIIIITNVTEDGSSNPFGSCSATKCFEAHG